MSGTRLGTLVTYNPWSVGPTTLLEEVAERFAALHIHHVAVIDGERRVIGMLSEADLLRARQTRRAVAVGSGVSDTGDPPLIYARDVMSRSISSVAPTDEFRTALALLLERRIHALPVVDKGRLVGMITSRDFLREFSYGDHPATREPVFSLLPARPPEGLPPDATLDEALLHMQEIGVSVLPITQGECPVGIVADRDISREKCRREDLALDEVPSERTPTVLQITRNSPVIRSGQRLCEAAAAMVDHALPAVTVVNQSNRLLGLITEDDLLRVMYDAQE